MSATLSAVDFSGMARKSANDPTAQVNFRLKLRTVEWMKSVSEKHMLHPTLTQLVEAGIEMLKASGEFDTEPQQHPDAKPKPRK